MLRVIVDSSSGDFIVGKTVDQVWVGWAKAGGRKVGAVHCGWMQGVVLEKVTVDKTR